jgi:hypothetical protein
MRFQIPSLLLASTALVSPLTWKARFDADFCVCVGPLRTREIDQSSPNPPKRQPSVVNAVQSAELRGFRRLYERRGGGVLNSAALHFTYFVRKKTFEGIASSSPPASAKPHPFADGTLDGNRGGKKWRRIHQMFFIVQTSHGERPLVCCVIDGNRLVRLRNYRTFRSEKVQQPGPLESIFESQFGVISPRPFFLTMGNRLQHSHHFQK